MLRLLTADCHDEVRMPMFSSTGDIEQTRRAYGQGQETMPIISVFSVTSLRENVSLIIADALGASQLSNDALV